MEASRVALADVARAAAQKLGYPVLKAEQLEVVVQFLSGRDVFAVLPTGFGKSLCYALLPLAFSKLENQEAIVIVVTPLTAIMKDQVDSFSTKGVSAAYVTGEVGNELVKKRVHSGHYQLVFITPELLIDNRHWRGLLTSSTYVKRLRGLIIDEAHCIVKWGYTFRSTLRRIGEIRSILPPSVCIMALTATATKTLRHALSKIIGLQHPFVLAMCPSKHNLMYSVSDYTNVELVFDAFAAKLNNLRKLMPRVIIYCHSFEDCSDIYIFFKDYLGKNFTEPPGAPNLPRFRLMDMFTSVTDKSIKDEIIERFTKQSQLRIVVATVAFGLGINCPDVRQIVHVGAPDDTESYIQETGRAGRDGLLSLATLLTTKGKRHSKSEEILEYMDNKTVCRRDFLFKDMEAYERSGLGSKCVCCDICRKSCECGSCSNKLESFITIQ